MPFATLVALVVVVPSVAIAAPTQKPWRSKLAVRACALDPLELPAETEIALHATLLVHVADGVGSAVVISPDGFALTAAHVVGSAKSVVVVADSRAKLRAQVVRVDAIQDVALLKVEALGDAKCLQPVSGNASIGSDVFVLGSPAGAELSFSVAKGIVSSYRDFSGVRFVQLDASLNPGNSGGPVVDATGRVVAIASWKVSHVAMEGLAFAVPIDVALASLDVDLGESSAADWREFGGRRAEQSTDMPRSTAAPASPEQIERAATSRRRATFRTGLIASGATAAGLGALSVIATATAYYAGSRMGPSAWRAAVAFNTIGWVMVGLGVTLVGSGLLVRKKPRTRAKAALAFGRDGMKVNF